MADQPTAHRTDLAALAEADAPQLLIEAVEDMRRLLAENRRLREALTRLRDCDWIITPADRMDAVRQIAREALGDA